MALPPKVVRDTVRRHTNGEPIESTALVRLPNFGLAETPQSLPVLEAFHEFIENERKAARSKLVTLSLFFIAVVISLIAAAMFISITFFDQIRGDMNIVQGESENTRRQFIAVKNSTKAALAGLDKRADMLTEDFRKSHDALQANHNETTSLVTQLGEMSEAMELLKRENSALRRDLSAVNDQFPAVSNTLTSAVAEIERLRGLVVDAAREPAAPPATGGRTNIVASLLIDGSDTETPWHFPIPE